MADIKKLLESKLNLKIISFYNENPSTVDTSRSIAAWLNWERKEVKRALDNLCKFKILIPHRIGSSIAYAYTQDKRIIKEIEKFLRTQ